VISVVPIWELCEHEKSTCCVCDPTLELVNGEMLITHNAMSNQSPGDEWGVIDDR
jgi:hypothetical protein